MKLAVDFGSCSLRAARCDDSKTVQFPSLALRDPNSLKLTALGEEALESPSGRVVLPVKGARILDWEAAVALLKRALQRLGGKGKPQLWMSVPAQLNLMQRRIWRELGQEAGASRVELVESPICCAAGSGCEVNRPFARLVLDAGGGNLDLGLLAGGEILSGQTVELAGADLDLAIQAWMRAQKGLLISLKQAEEVKSQLLCLLPTWEVNPLLMEVSGLGAVDGRPTRLEVSQLDLLPVADKFLSVLREAVLHILATATPEAASDLMQEGLWLGGGLAPLRGLSNFIEQISSLPVLRIEQPQAAVLRGLVEISRISAA